MTPIPHHEHEHHDDSHHHEHSWWEGIAEALHLPGYSHSHDHSALVRQANAEANNLAIRTVWQALAVLGLTTSIQILIVAASGSVALTASRYHS